MAASDLVLLATVKAWVPIKNSNTVDDALLASLITACSNDFMRATKRPDLLYATYTETRIGDGSSRMTLRHWPIQAVSSLQIFTPPATAATAVNQSEDQIEPGFYWDEDLDPELCWTLYLTPSTVPSRFSDEGQVVINYSAGYVGPNDDVDTGTALPLDIQQAIVDWIAYRYENRPNVATTQRKSTEGESVETQLIDAPPNVLSVIERYMRERPSYDRRCEERDERLMRSGAKPAPKGRK